MTTTSRDRPATGHALDWDRRSLLPERAGLPWWVAVLLALLCTAAGALADLERANQLTFVFKVCYFVGCLLAVAVVERKGLFGPMVQPPLILAATVPVVVLLASSMPKEGGATAAALVVGTPLINTFPAMAITTALTLAVGVLRLMTQRPPAEAAASEAAVSDAAVSEAAASGAAVSGAAVSGAAVSRGRSGTRSRSGTRDQRPEPHRERPSPSPRPRNEPRDQPAAAPSRAERPDRAEQSERAERPQRRRRRTES